jgi:DNA replication licensing factor MCM4
MSRFDLIYLILDKAEQQSDQRLASHIVELYFAPHERTTRKEQLLSVHELTEYIMYARTFCHPRLTDDATAGLVGGYVQMRKAGANHKTISATPRQLESLIRLAEAHAKMRLASEITAQDVDEAIRLVQSGIQQAALDPSTGFIDMDLITTGKSAFHRKQMQQLAREIEKLLADRSGTAQTFNSVYKAIVEQSSTVRMKEKRERESFILPPLHFIRKFLLLISKKLFVCWNKIISSRCREIFGIQIL